jgi:hypothetical protein
MEIKIVDRTEKPKKATSVKNVKMPDDKIDLFRRLACDLYVLSNNMVLSHDMYRRITLGGEYGELASANANAMAFFTKPENANYVAARKLEFYKFGFDEYCRIKNIEHGEFRDVKNKEYEAIANLSPSEIREKNYIELEQLKETTKDPQILAQIVKQQTDLMDAKYKDKGVELSESEKLIHFYLPAAICDKCPHKKFIEDQHKDLPEIDLEID